MREVDGRRDHWARLSRAWEESGQTQWEFCAARGVELGTFRWWRWRLGGERAVSSGPSVNGGSGTWVEVSRAVAGGQPMPVVAPSRELRLVFCDGLELHIPKGFDAETLRSVLSILGEVSC